MNINKITMVLIALLVILPVSAVAQNTTQGYLDIKELDINRMDGLDTASIEVERGDNIDIQIVVHNPGSTKLENVQIDAFIAGYKYNAYEKNLVSDYTKTFDLGPNAKRSFDLSLNVPVDMEKKDAKLRIIISDENSEDVIIYNYQLNIKGANEDNAVQIKSFLISPSETIEAGRALSFKVKVKNIGDNDLDDVTVKVAVPRLNIQAYETIDELRADDGDGETQSFEALLLRIPSDTPAGEYDIIATVEFDKYQDVEMVKTITVTEPTSTSSTSEKKEKTLVTMPSSVELTKGTSGAIFPILLDNQADSAKTYVVSVSGTSDWATTSFEPSSVVIVKAGDSKTVYLKLAAKDDAQVGDKVFQISIASGDESSETSVVASVQGEQTTENSSSLKTVLEWALIILIIVLIVLGLILVFVKMGKGKNDSDEPQTYY